MVCRGDIGELRQILWIRDICRGIRLSAFEALPRIGAECLLLALAFDCLRPHFEQTNARHTKYVPSEASRSLSDKGDESGMRAARAVARWSAG
jgi:hypothetical protein